MIAALFPGFHAAGLGNSKDVATLNFLCMMGQSLSSIIRQMLLPKGMLLRSNPLHNTYPPPTWEGGV